MTLLLIDKKVISLRKMKEYRLSFIILLILAVIIAFNTNSLRSKESKSNLGLVGFYDAQNTYNVDSNISQCINDYDLPLPLKGLSEQVLYRKAYILSYNKDYKLPNWVAWHLTADHTNGEVKRPGNAWHEDIEVPEPRANNGDYKGSGWTRGHMCPAGDNKWDADAMYETFLLSNCCPQNANLNTGTWNQIEIATRRWAERWGDLYIVCGPILFRQQHETIGENNIVIPEAFFKVIVCLNNKYPKGIGFICRNTDGNRNKDLYVNSIKQVERITGITFFPHLSKEMADAIKNDANIKDWEQLLGRPR